MKILILGGQGMAGHVIVSYFKQKPNCDVYYTSRDTTDENSLYLDVTDSTRLETIIDSIKPDITINCIGILNDFASHNTKLAFQVNSLLPHQLVKLTERCQGKLIHISTDCVFLGDKGDYTEADIPDGTSIYAQSKQLGEVINDNHLTIRTSIIGPELKQNGIGLFLWFINQTGDIKGFENVFWNGVTTWELAKAIDFMIEHNVTGLYHLSAPNKISKYELLLLFQEIFQKTNINVLPDKQMRLDRTIRSTRTDVHYPVPTYRTMLVELKEWMDKR